MRDDTTYDGNHTDAFILAICFLASISVFSVYLCLFLFFLDTSMLPTLATN